MDELVRFDAELVKGLRRERGWTQARLASETGSVGTGWIRKLEAGKLVRLEWNGKNGAVNAGEDLAALLKVPLDTLILDLLNGQRVKQLRVQRNWDPEELAEHARVGVEIVTRAEADQYVRRDQTRALANSFGVSPLDLMFREEPKGLNFDAVNAGPNMRAGMYSLSVMILRRSKALGEPIPSNDESMKDAHGRLMFATWKLGKDVGTEGFPRKAKSPYVLAIETAIGSELASQSRIYPDSDAVIHAKRIALGLDEAMISVLSRCEQFAGQNVQRWIAHERLDLDWNASEPDLEHVSLVGGSSLAHAILSTRSKATDEIQKDCSREAIARIDFMLAFVSRHYHYFTSLSPSDHSQFIRLVMMFVLGSYIAGIPRQRLSFIDVVIIEKKAQDLLSRTDSTISRFSAEAKKGRAC